MTYRSELLNRFAGRQNIICFRRLGLDAIQRIVRREIEGLDAAYRSRGFGVSIDKSDLESLCRNRYDPTIGARGLPGFISSGLEPILVDAILDGRTAKEARVRYEEKFSVDFVG